MVRVSSWRPHLKLAGNLDKKWNHLRTLGPWIDLHPETLKEMLCISNETSTSTNTAHSTHFIGNPQISCWCSAKWIEAIQFIWPPAQATKSLLADWRSSKLLVEFKKSPSLALTTPNRPRPMFDIFLSYQCPAKPNSKSAPHRWCSPMSPDPNIAIGQMSGFTSKPYKWTKAWCFYLYDYQWVEDQSNLPTVISISAWSRASKILLQPMKLLAGCVASEFGSQN